MEELKGTCNIPKHHIIRVQEPFRFTLCPTVVKLEGSLGDLSGFCLLTAMRLDLREATPTLQL